MNPPLVSILLPVFNGTPWVRETLDSMLQQTLTDFEIIAINDGSKDDSLTVLHSYNDPRIRVVDQENQGLAATLNTAIAMARGRYLARQDQDDLSLPERLARQVHFLDNHPDIGVVGTWAEIIDANGTAIGMHKHPEHSATLAEFLLWNNPFVHSSLMFRRTVFDSVGGYSTDRNRQPPEDYELMSRVARTWKTANIPEVLHRYREVRGSMSRVSSRPFEAKVVMLSAENWAFARPGADPALCCQAALFLNGLDPRPQQTKPRFSWLKLLAFTWFLGAPAQPDRVINIQPSRALLVQVLKSFVKLLIYRRAIT